MKDGTYQYYAGNMVYKKVIENSIVTYPLNYLLFDEGLVTKSSGGYSYEYHLKDHLGNTRVTFQPNGSTTTTTQVAEYYPFGSSFLPVSPAGTNKYLYNGKEKQDDILSGTALDLYDYGARFYDPIIGRWHVIDPACEEEDQESWTPYHYVLNNPIKNTDPDGESPTLITGAIGFGVGALIGGALEMGTQLYNNGSVNNWDAVGGSALQGAITGGAAGLTGGASLLVTAGVAGGANAVGGAVNRTMQGESTTLTNVVADATVGAVLGVAGKVIGNTVSNATNNLSNSAKGKLGEAISEVKFGAQGYKSIGNDVVKTGTKTATGKDAVAKFDHKMTNVFTGKQITVESKFNTSGLTSNQRAVVKQGYGITIDRTTSQGLGNGAKAATVGTGSGVDAQRNKKP